MTFSFFETYVLLKTEMKVSAAQMHHSLSHLGKFSGEMQAPGEIPLLRVKWILSPFLNACIAIGNSYNTF